MKKIFSLPLLMAGALFYAQQSINFENAPFKDILAKAKKEKKLVFLDAYASWCGPCKMMAKNIFPKDEVKDFYNTHFINAHFDMEKGEGRDIAMKYGVRSYPTFLFLNGDGEVVFKGMGALDEKNFIALGKEANAVGKGGSAKERFEKGEKDPAFLLNTIKMNAGTDPVFAHKVADRYFSQRAKGTAYTQEEVSILLHFLKSKSDALYTTFVQDKAEIVKHLPEATYQQFDNQFSLNTVVEKTFDHQTGTIDEEQFLAETEAILGKAEAKTTLDKLKVYFYPSVGNFNAFEKAALVYYGEGDGFEDKELNRVAYTFAEKISNPESLKKAVVWAEKAVMKAETAENTYILAKLYLKTGNKDAAKMYAEQSLKLTKQRGMDTSIPEQLLSEIKK